MKVEAVSKSPTHTLIKKNENQITLLKGLGVEGDAHQGLTVKHRSRVAKDPTTPNIRQVHLMPSELFAELAHKGIEVKAGEMGENITTSGIDLINLPLNTILKIGPETIIQITGLRNPCSQLNRINENLLKAVLDKDEQGNIIRKAGIMSIVLQGGNIRVGDTIEIEFPEKPFNNLQPV
ncbi:MAG: MOSC domain-containing protein [Flavobacteriaceae bacterium]|nr:MOSC domain-containing protein [Flavobacteriaceae bacterium]